MRLLERNGRLSEIRLSWFSTSLVFTVDQYLYEVSKLVPQPIQVFLIIVKVYTDSQVAVARRHQNASLLQLARQLARFPSFESRRDDAGAEMRLLVV